MGGRVAVTGATGFLGGHVCAALEQAGYLPTPIPRAVRQEPGLLGQWLEAARPMAVIHTAGLTDVRQCLAEPLQAVEVNVLQTARLLDAVRVMGQGDRPIPMVYVATDKSFGDQINCGLETPFQPKFPYDMSKACEDMLVESYRQTYELTVATVRFPNLYGEGDPNQARLLPSLCSAAASGGEFIVRTNLTGSTRQYIYVKDTANIIVTTLKQQLAGEKVWPISHFAPNVVKSVGDVIADLEALSGRKLSVKVINQSGETSHLSLKDQNGLGFAYTDWTVGLRATWNSYQ